MGPDELLHLPSFLLILWGEQQWSPASLRRTDGLQKQYTCKTPWRHCHQSAVSPQKQLLKVKSQALLLGRAADSIKTGCKVSNAPSRVKPTNAMLCPGYKEPAMARFWGKGCVEVSLEEFWEKNFRTSHLLLAACGSEGLCLMLWGWQCSSRSSGLRPPDTGADPQLFSSCLRRIFLPFCPSSSLPLYPVSVPQSTSAAVTPHNGVNWQSQHKNSTFMGSGWEGEERGSTLYVQSPHPAANRTFQWVFFHLMHKIPFVVTREFVSLKKTKTTPNKKQQLSFPSSLPFPPKVLP